MKELIVSRTGKGPKATSNAKAAGAEEGGMLIELRKVLGERTNTMVPPTPAKPTAGEADADADAEEQEMQRVETGGAATGDVDGADPVPMEADCPSCGAEMLTVADGPGDSRGDYFLVDDEAYCKYCGGRVEAKDE